MTTRRPAWRPPSAAPAAAMIGASVILTLLAGCSGGPVGSVYEAERTCWRAIRLEQRLSLHPGGGSNAMAPAIQAYERVLARYPLSAAGDDRGSRQSLLRTRTLAARRLASLRLAAGQTAQAVGLLWDLREEALGDPLSAVGFYGDLVQTVARGGSADSLANACREMYERLPAAQPDGTPIMPVLQAPLGRINAYALTGRSSEAMAATSDALGYYDRVGQEHPGSATEAVALTLKADLLSRTGRTGEAIAILKRARAIPSAGELAPQIGLLLGQLLEQPPGTPAAAAQVYEEVLRNHPGKSASLQAGMRLAMLLAAAGMPDSALAVLDRVDRDSPRDLENVAQARFQKGLVLAASGRQSESIRELRAVATDFPRTRAGLLAPLRVAEYYRTNGDSLAMQATLREAAQGYERLVEDLRADPAQGSLVMAAIDRLIDARLRLRDWARLAPLLEERATAFPRDQRSPAALAEAAQILDARLGDRQGSIRVLRQLISRYPNHSLAKAAQDRVAQLGGSIGS